jgi:ribosomal protein S6--L-glutamate ligase
MIKKPKLMIGWEEWCRLPDLGLPAVKAKIDTGAKTSALHAFDIETFTDGGLRFVRFSVHPLQKRKKIIRICTAPLVEERIVVSSNGEYERRPVILTTIACGPISIETEISLSSRHKMAFRMLLGRTALKQAKFLVDPAKSFLQGRLENAKTLYTQK